ncbi:MAG: hypothetical protein GF372_01880 [Candidatus Marinimicrobia bacterium]|nr:hypothetical protein [Candidatus Neomarinimicrobiota bacterium]
MPLFFRNHTVYLFIVLICFTSAAHAEEYWQQDVQYTINAELDTDAHIIRGFQQLVYTNNSPDSLFQVFFHLYQNAYTKDSYYDIMLRKQFNTRIQQLSPDEEAGTNIYYIQDEKDRPYEYTIDNTILRIDLNEPLVPGEQLTFRIKFETRYGAIPRRMKREGNTYIGAHWYPRIAVYDAERGWNRDQHLGMEFYGDFGTFEVNLTFPEHFIVGATGVLQNRNQVLPRSLMEKLDLRNFKEKPWGEAPSVIIPPSDQLKTWRYRAENVHDFAFIASPDFRIGTAEWNGVQIYSYAKEQHASGWQDAADFTARLVESFSKRWGKFPYPKMIVSDVNSGMEYPMLTADGGSSPTYYGLLAHEVGHNYFYAIVGSNETYRALLDEGFTNFIAAEAMEDILGPNNNTYWDITGNWYEQTFYPEFGRKYYRNDLRYMRMSKSGYLENPLATHSNKFREYREYRQVYYKGATMLWNLEYVLGDSLFQEVVRTYFKKWMFKHPYPDDFIQVAEDVSGTDLNWFFDEWIYSSSTVDYRVGAVRNVRTDNDNYTGYITLKRKDFMAMPIDLEVTFQDGTEQKYIIPVNDYFAKAESDAIIAEPWFGWGEINDHYILVTQSRSPVKTARIDPSGRLSDLNRLDNQSGIGFPLKWRFDNMQYYMPSLDEYDIWLRPSFLYNSVDGLKPGVHWHSNYLPSEFLSWWDLELGVWYGPLSQKIGYQASFESPVQGLGRLTKFVAGAQNLEGRAWYHAGLFGIFREKLYSRPFTEYSVIFHRNKTTNANYAPQSFLWESGLQQFFQGYIRQAVQTGVGTLDFVANWESSFLEADFSYAKLSAEILGETKIFNKNLKFRLVALDLYGDFPLQRAFYIAGGSPAEAAEANWLYRSDGSLPPVWYENNHVGVGGSLNLRGYLGQNIILNNALGFNAELELMDVSGTLGIGFVQSRLYGFIDSGIIKPYFNSKIDYTHMADLGVGITADFPWIPASLGNYQMRFDIPFYVADPMAGEDNFKLRWLIGFGRSW